MKCKNWPGKINNFVVRKLKSSIKINNGQQQVLNASTMPAMPKEKESITALTCDDNYSDMKMKEHQSEVCGGGGASRIKTDATQQHHRLSQQYICPKTSPGPATSLPAMPPASTARGTIAYGGSHHQYDINYSLSDCSSVTTESASILAEKASAATLTNTSRPHQETSSLDVKRPVEVPGKKSANDFVFGKYIGDGSFSTVYLARDIHSNREYAIKVCDKHHILREKKQEYIRTEREVMHIMNNVPGFVNLSCTFQDKRNLYFVMTYAKNGDLLPYINKVGSFDLECTRQYAAELVLAVENMHKRGVIHRDLKPENILLDESMHTLIADFGSAKILSVETGNTTCCASSMPNSRTVTEQNSSSPASSSAERPHRRRRGSFVGTAQYVSPEVLQGDLITKAADLWALGCIIYQMISGLPPFRGGSDYLIFREIMSLNLVFPEGFDKDAEDLVRNLLKLRPEERIGAQDKCNHYESFRIHPFFDGINWDTVRLQQPPQIFPYLPGASKDQELRSHYRVPDNLEPGLDDRQLTRLLGLELGTVSGIELEKKTEPKNILNISDAEKQKRLDIQKSDKWHMFADNEVILKKGFVNKRKGLFARKRMLLLTTGPRLIYIDPVQMVKKGEIPWSPELRVEPKNFKIFFVHSPNRTYYLEDPEGYALEWVDAIEDVREKFYGGKLL